MSIMLKEVEERQIRISDFMPMGPSLDDPVEAQGDHIDQNYQWIFN